MGEIGRGWEFELSSSSYQLSPRHFCNLLESKVGGSADFLPELSVKRKASQVKSAVSYNRKTNAYNRKWQWRHWTINFDAECCNWRWVLGDLFRAEFLMLFFREETSKIFVHFPRNSCLPNKWIDINKYIYIYIKTVVSVWKLLQYFQLPDMNYCDILRHFYNFFLLYFKIVKYLFQYSSRNH